MDNNTEEVYHEYVHFWPNLEQRKKIKEEELYSDKDINALENLFKIESNKDCPICKSRDNVIKYGKSKNRIQRYRCKRCSKVFSDITGSPLSYSKKPISLWIRYMFFMKDRISLRDIAKTLNINLNTSFQWRHKILSVMGTKIMQKKLYGIIEINEIRLREGSKGKYKSYSMKNRDINKSDLDSYITVLNCRDKDDNKFIKPVTKENYIKKELLNEVLKPIIKKGTEYIASPSRYDYLYFTKENNLKLSTEIGQYHIAGIDNKKAYKRGMDIKRFLRKYRNIGTKYLSFYINWFVIEIEKINEAMNIFKRFIIGKKQLRIQDFKGVNYKGEIHRQDRNDERVIFLH